MLYTKNDLQNDYKKKINILGIVSKPEKAEKIYNFGILFVCEELVVDCIMFKTTLSTFYIFIDCYIF